MKKIIAIVLTTLVLTGCMQAKPICTAKMKVGGGVYDVPVYNVSDSKERAYDAGYPINGWTNASQFHNIGNCPVVR